MAAECSTENISAPRLIHVAVPTDQLTVDSCVNDLSDDLKEQSNISGIPSMVIQLHNLQQEEDIGEHAHKRIRLDNDFTPELNSDLSVKQILFNINKAICLRLDGIENKLECLSQKMKTIDDKVDSITNYLKQNGTSIISPAAQRKSGAVIVGIPQADTKQEPAFDNNVQNLGPNVTLITLNTEDDYPSGCWLGDESNPEMRVRVPVTQSDLLHIHSNCRTAEKMALTLLDYLFDRETQASSNLSGQGKHGKKQLDPLMIYGIRCHLIHRFNVAEGDWHRIKQNIDSKCRTAFRRRQKGMPLTVKAFRGKGNVNYDGPDSVQMPNVHMGSSTSDEDSLSHDDSNLQIQTGDVDISQAVMHSADMGGEIQILHATPEQISQLQQAQHIQILQGHDVIQQVQHMDGSAEGVQVSLPVPVQLPVSTVATDNGEIIQIQRCENEAS